MARALIGTCLVFGVLRTRRICQCQNCSTMNCTRKGTFQILPSGFIDLKFYLYKYLVVAVEITYYQRVLWATRLSTGLLDQCVWMDMLLSIA